MPLDNRYGLKFNEFKPTVFTPTIAKPIEYDEKASIEAQEKAYNWEQKDYQVSSGYREVGDKIRSQLNPAEYNWWDEKFGNSINNIYAESDIGNYESAIRTAQNEARKLFDDTDLKNRIEYNSNREKKLNKINSRNDINDDVKRASKLLNIYNYNGNVEYNPTFDPVSSMSMVQIAGYVANLVPERSTSSQNNTSNNLMLDKDGNVTNDPTKAINKLGTVGGGIGSTVHWKSADELRGMLYNVISTDSKINSALKQQYDVSTILWKEANRIANDESLTESEREKAKEDIDKYQMEITDKDGLIPSYQDWLKRKVVPMIESMSYKNISTSDTRHSTFDDDVIKSNAAKFAKNAMNNADDKTVNGTPIEINSSDNPLSNDNDTNDASIDANLIGGK